MIHVEYIKPSSIITNGFFVVYTIYVMTAQRNQTQNQGISRVVILYSEIGLVSQVIKINSRTCGKE